MEISESKAERIKILESGLQLFIRELDEVLWHLVETDQEIGLPLDLPENFGTGIMAQSRIPKWNNFKTEIDSYMGDIVCSYSAIDVKLSPSEVLSLWLNFDQISLADIVLVGIPNYEAYIGSRLLSTNYL